MTDYKIIHGSADTKQLIPAESVDLIVTSPPYNLGMEYSRKPGADLRAYSDYLWFSETWMANALYWTKETGRMCVNMPVDISKGGKFPVLADLTQTAGWVGWQYHTTIIWNEGTISRRTAWGSWCSASAPHVIAPVEAIVVFYKDSDENGRWKKADKGVSDITKTEFMDWVLGLWTFPGESAKRVGHEAPFPRELPKRCIKLFSYVGDTVLDPFLGSGTTLIEASNLGRKGIGIELEKHYCDLAEKRIKENTYDF